MLAKAENGHANILELFKLAFIATFNNIGHLKRF
jgi:hypothetical protein